MIQAIWISCLLLVVTTVVHCAAMMISLRGLQALHQRRTPRRNHLSRAIPVTYVVIVMFLTAIVETFAWAMTYLKLGAIDGLEDALYFSTVTFTTLGYGDITLQEDWRLLSAFEAANGVIMFGWSTAVILAAVQRVYLFTHDHGDCVPMSRRSAPASGTHEGNRNHV